MHSVTRPHSSRPACWPAHSLRHCQHKKRASRQLQSLTMHTEYALQLTRQLQQRRTQSYRHDDNLTA